jgi:hypothetical protein
VQITAKNSSELVLNNRFCAGFLPISLVYMTRHEFLYGQLHHSGKARLGQLKGQDIKTKTQSVGLLHLFGCCSGTKLPRSKFAIISDTDRTMVHNILTQIVRWFTIFSFKSSSQKSEPSAHSLSKILFDRKSRDLAQVVGVDFSNYFIIHHLIVTGR